MPVDDASAQARDGFRARFGREPLGVWSAPGRVNLIGEHTDYNQGLVLPFALDRRTYVALAGRDDHEAHVASSWASTPASIDLRAVGPGCASGWAAYLFGTAWGLGQVGADLAQVAGFDAYVVSDVPVGAGLSSSAALECALAVALDDLWGLGADRAALVRATHLAENEIVGAPTGILDQSAALLGEPDSALFLDCRDGRHELIDLGLAAAGLVVLVVDTGVQHAHAGGGYAERRASCELGARRLGVPSLREVGPGDLDRAAGLLDEETFRRVRHVVTENGRVGETVQLLRTRGPRSIGRLLLASHASMRDDFEISVPELDLAVQAAVDAGALGARMTGGGFGGSAIALVEAADADRVGVRVARAFESAGFSAPRIFAVTASGGARREA